MDPIIQAFARLNKVTKQRLWKKLKTVWDQYPEDLIKVPMNQMAAGSRAPKEVWMSRGYLVQIFDAYPGWEVMAISRNAFDGHFTRFLDGIAWDKIQELKSECGRGGSEAMEIYPTEDDAQSVFHRYIWVRKSGQSFMKELNVGWKNSTGFVRPAVLDLMTIIQAAASAPGSAKPGESSCMEAASSVG